MAGSSNSGSGMITGINVTPLVDITLVLLLIFIVTAKIIATPAVPLDLPKSATSEEVQVVFSVVLPRQGPVRVDGEPVADDQALTAKARQAFERDPQVRAILQADGDVTHREVVHALDLLRAAGISRIAFAAVPGPGEDLSAKPDAAPRSGAHR